MLFLNLKNFWRSIKKDYLLLLILFLGLFLRGINPTFGSPSLYVSNDEAIAHLSALNMLANRTPYSLANYTPFGAYIQIPFIGFSYLTMRILGLIENLKEFEFLLLTNEGYFLFIPRLISALFGTLTILVIYKISKKLFTDKKVALITAFLCAVSFNMVHISSTGRPWAAALFFLSLSVYFSLKKRSFAAFLSCLIGFGFHQVTILIVPLLIFLHKGRKKYLSLSLIFLLLGVVVLNSLTLRTGFIHAISNNQSFLLKGRLLTDILTGDFNFLQSLNTTVGKNLSIYYLQNLIVTDGVLFFLGILGIILTYFKYSNVRKIAIYIASYYIFASLFFHPLIRYLLPIFILLIPFCAYALIKLIRSRVTIGLILIVASINSFYWVGIYSRPPTFILAQNFIKKNINPSIPIAYTGGRFYVFAPDNQSVSHIQTQDPNAWALLSTYNNYAGENVRNIIYLNKFKGKTKLDQLKSASLNYPIAYVVDYYLDPRDRLLDQDPAHFVLVKQFNPTWSKSIEGIAETLFDSSSNFDTFEKRPNSSMFRLERTGPYFEILKVKRFN